MAEPYKKRPCHNVLRKGKVTVVAGDGVNYLPPPPEPIYFDDKQDDITHKPLRKKARVKLMYSDVNPHPEDCYLQCCNGCLNRTHTYRNYYSYSGSIERSLLREIRIDKNILSEFMCECSTCDNCYQLYYYRVFEDGTSIGKPCDCGSNIQEKPIMTLPNVYACPEIEEWVYAPVSFPGVWHESLFQDQP